MDIEQRSTTATFVQTPAQQRVIEGDHGHWIISGSPASGKTATLLQWLEQRLDRGQDPDRVLLLTPDRRAARGLAMASARIGEADADIRPGGYPGFAQRLIERFWALVAGQFEIDAVEPTFLAFDLAQFACLAEYRRDPGALQRLTIRDQSLVVQVLDTMSLAAANGLGLDEAWRRTALGRGLDPEHEVIEAALDLSHRFRNHCQSTGQLPFDMQIEAAAWLLEQEEVVGDLLDRFDLLALDALDEFVPVMARRLAGLTGRFSRAMITYSPDGGIRWKLGASVEQTSRICRWLIKHGDFRELCLRQPRSSSPVIHSGSAGWLRDVLTSDPDAPVTTPPSPDGWTVTVAGRPDTMAGQVVGAVAELIDDGVPPEEIVLLAPRIDPLLEAEIRRGSQRRSIPLHVDRHWRSLFDDPASRACLTALRATTPDGGRQPSSVEIADLLVNLTGRSAVDVQRYVRITVDPRGGRLRPLESIRVDLPAPVERLLTWAESVDDSTGVVEHLESFIRDVLDASDLTTGPELIEACRRLISTARRIGAQSAGAGDPDHDLFFAFIDSNVIASDGNGYHPDAVLFTTPHAFLMNDRSVRVQCWLDVASPAWWDPPASLLSDPHALAAPNEAMTGSYADEERARTALMARLTWNLATRCTDSIFAFASQTGPDGSMLDGPLLEGVQLLGAPQR